MNVKIDDDIKDDLINYCKLNNLKINKFVNELLRKSLIIEKFGEKPPFFNDEPISKLREDYISDLSLRDKTYGIGMDTIGISDTPTIEEIQTNIKKKNKRSL